ncbi:MAG: hypothetical protein ACNA8W_06910 [Bradymonadaceae bacterium]
MPRAVAFLLMISIVQGGCSAPCRTAQSGYEEALLGEARLLGEVPAVTKSDPHFVVGLSASFLTKTANDVVAHTMNRALSSPERDARSGSAIALRPRLENISIVMDKACGACVRLEADLGGRLEASLPLVGKQEGTLGGRISFVTPVLIEGLDSGEAVLRLDPAAGKLLEPPRVTLHLPWLPARWSQGIEDRVAALISHALQERFSAVDLARFDLPDLGVRGLELHPSAVRTDPDSQVLLVSLMSNLSVPVSPGNARIPDSSADVFIGARSDLLTALLQVLMHEGTIARRYTLQGRASAGGRIHATLRGLRLEPKQSGLGLQMDFDLWRLGRWGSCFSVAGTATGKVGLENGDIGVEIEQVVFSDSGMASSANWMAAQFLGQGSREVLRQALERNVPVMPGVSLRFSGQSLSREGDFVLLSATGTVEKTSAGRPHP